MSKKPPVVRGGSYENVLVGLFALSGGVAAIDAQALFFVMPFVAADLALNNVQIGLTGMAGLLGWSIGGLIFGPLSDHLGRRKPFLIAAFLGTALFSVATALAIGFVSLMVARLLVGLAEGPIIPVEQSIILAESSPQRLGLNMGLAQNFGAQLFGSLLAPILLIGIAQRYGWQASFFIAAVPSALMAALLAWLVREPTRATCTSKESREALGGKLVTILAQRNIQLCLFVGSCIIAWYFLQLTFLPLYMIRVLRIDPMTMGLVVSVFGVGGMVSAVLVTGLSDRIGRRAAIVIFALLGTVAPLSILLADTNLLLLGLAIFTGSLITGTIPLFMATVPLETVAPRHAATATALVMGLCQIVGGLAGPIVGGVLADRYGLSSTMWLSGALALAAACAAMGLRPPFLLHPPTVPAQ